MANFESQDYKGDKIFLKGSGAGTDINPLIPNHTVVTPNGDSAMDEVNDAIRVNMVAGGGSGGTSLADKAAFTEGTTVFTPVGGVYNEAIVGDPTEDQAAAVRITAKRAIHVNLRDVAGAEVSVGGGTQYDEDTAHTAAEKLMMAGVVRKDTPASLVGTDSDRTELIVGSTGKLWTDAAVSSVPAPLSTTGGGTEATALRVTLASDSTGVVSVDDNGSTISIDDGAGSITIDGSVSITGALPAGANNIGDVDVLTVPAPLNLVGGGTEAAALRVTIATDSTGVLSVDDNGGNLSIDDGGNSITVDGTLTVVQGTAANLQVEVRGAAAVDAAVVGNPVYVGGRASTAAPTEVSLDGDAQAIWLNRRGAVQATLVDAAGDSLVDAANDAVRVNIVAGAGSGGTAMADDAAFTVGTTSFTPAGGTYKSVRDQLDDNDAGVFAVTRTRALYTALETPGGLNVMDEGNTAVRVNIVAGAGSGGTAMTDDAAFTPGTTSFTPAGGTYRSVRDTVNDNDGGAFAMTSSRALLAALETPNGDSAMDDTNDAVRVNVVANTAVTIQDGGNVITVDGAVSITGSLPAGTNNIGDVDVLTVPAPLNVVGTGTEAAALRVTIATDSTGVLSVDDNGTTISVDDGAGSLTVDGSVSITGSLPAGTANIGDVDVLSVPAPLNVVGTGTEAAALRVTIATDSTGVLSVDDNGGSLTIDGSVSITGSLPAGSANIGDVDVLSLPALPAGSNNIGDVDVLTVPAPLNLVGGGTEAAALRVTIANNSTGVLSVDDNGTTISVDDGAGSLTIDGSVSITGALPAGTANIGDVDVLTVPAPLNVVGTGTEAAALRVTLATDSTGVLSVDDNGSTISVDDGAGSLTVDGSVSITGSLPAGSANIGDVDVLTLPSIPAGTNNIGDVDVLTLPSIPAGTNNIGDVDVLTLPALPTGTNSIGYVGIAPRTSGGYSAYKLISAATTNAASVKASAGQVFGWHITNTNAAMRFFKIYNKASAPTVGTDVPVLTLGIPGNTAGAGAVSEFLGGIEFATGIATATTTGAADADTGAVASTELIVNLFYK